MKKEEALTILRTIKQNDGKKYGIIEIGLFGSFARGTENNESDVDICVKTQTPDPFILAHLKEDLERRFNRYVDIVRVRETMNPFLKARISKEGIYV